MMQFEWVIKTHQHFFQYRGATHTQNKNNDTDVREKIKCIIKWLLSNENGTKTIPNCTSNEIARKKRNKLNKKLIWIESKMSSHTVCSNRRKNRNEKKCTIAAVCKCDLLHLYNINLLIHTECKFARFSPPLSAPIPIDWMFFWTFFTTLRSNSLFSLFWFHRIEIARLNMRFIARTRVSETASLIKNL